MGKSVKQILSIVAERVFPLSARGVVNKIPKGAEWVLFGEASHGTREFYETRAGEQSQTYLHRHDHLSSGNMLKKILPYVPQLLWTAEITKVLIKEGGFNAVAAEAGV